MKDPRLRKLCNLLVNYSCALKPGEKILIELFGSQPEVAMALIDEVYAAGGIPFVRAARAAGDAQADAGRDLGAIRGGSEKRRRPDEADAGVPRRARLRQRLTSFPA